MRHSALNRGVMRDWIQVAIETALPLPTDAEIMDRFGFTSPEQARTLLADLADRGEITICWRNGERDISLGRARPDGLPPAPRPSPSVVKTDPAVTAAVDRIKAILARSEPPAELQASAAPTAALVERSAKPPEPSPAPPAPVASPAPIVAPAPPVVASTRLAAAPRKAVTVNIPVEVFEELSRRAGAADMMPGTLAAQIVTAAMRGPGKLLVPAAGFRAAEVAGASLHDFASMLIRRGLEAHLAEAAA